MTSKSEGKHAPCIMRYKSLGLNWLISQVGYGAVLTPIIKSCALIQGEAPAKGNVHVPSYSSGYVRTDADTGQACAEACLQFPA